MLDEVQEGDVCRAGGISACSGSDKAHDKLVGGN